MIQTFFYLRLVDEMCAMTRLIALTDYKGRFGSKHFDEPYRSGLDKNLITRFFAELDIKVQFYHFSEVDLLDGQYQGVPVIYTSSEDIGYHYKSYIEDVVFSLELAGAQIIPGYFHLRANNNKVFMEQLRVLKLRQPQLSASTFGSIKELEKHLDQIQYPCILKESEGASGTGVFLVNSQSELLSKVKQISTSQNLKEDIKDYLRSKRHKGYLRESRYRTKFIVQEFIPDLKNDWKIYIFGEALYIFDRPILKGRGIKASGGGYDNYRYGQEANAPDGIFEYAWDIFERLNVPHASLDIAYDGKQFYLIEFQSLYFGTAGIPYSTGFFQKSGSEWSFVEQKYETEQVFTQSIHWFLNK